MNKRNSTKAWVLALGALALIPAARADQWNQETRFTFSAPVAIPGQVLQPGSYVFRLADSPSDRDIVQVLTSNERKVIATFLAIHDYRLKPSGKPILKFEERPAGEPEAIRAWFYPGDNFGHQFVYPKPAAVALAKANQAPVAAMPAALADNTRMPTATLAESHVTELTAAPLKAETSSEVEVEVDEVFAIALVPGTEMPEQLPETASPLPLIGLTGLASTLAAVVLRKRRTTLAANRR